MDQIFIKGLAIQTTIGVFEWEKQTKQTLIIDLDMAWDIKPAAEQDDLTKTLDYAAISLFIEQFANENTVELVETLAQRLADALLAKYQLTWLQLSITKPHAVHNAQGVGVKITRTAQ